MCDSHLQSLDHWCGLLGYCAPCIPRTAASSSWAKYHSGSWSSSQRQTRSISGIKLVGGKPGESASQHRYPGDAGTQGRGHCLCLLPNSRVRPHGFSVWIAIPAVTSAQPYGRRRLLGANVTSPLPTRGSSGREPSPALSPVPGDNREGEVEL